MTIEQNQDGAWIISALVGNHLLTRRFYGYTRREAIQAFREAIKSERGES